MENKDKLHVIVFEDGSKFEDMLEQLYLDFDNTRQTRKEFSERDNFKMCFRKIIYNYRYVKL